MGFLSFLFRRKTDPYYANYERSFEKLNKDIGALQQSKLQAKRQRDELTTIVWVFAIVGLLISLAYGHWAAKSQTSSNAESALRVLLVCSWPAAAYLIHNVLRKVWRLVDVRRDSRLEKLHLKLRTLVTELKDSARFDKVQELLQKYDPEYRPIQPLPLEAAPRQRSASTPPPGTPLGRWAAGASSHFLPALDRLATSLVGGDPVLMQQIRDVNAQADILRNRLTAAQTRVADLEKENQELRQQLGLPEVAGGQGVSDEDNTAQELETQVHNTDAGRPHVQSAPVLTAMSPLQPVCMEPILNAA